MRENPLSILRRSTVASEAPLLTYLIGPLGLKRKTAKNLLKYGAVAVNGTPVQQFDHPLAVGDVVFVSGVSTAAAAARLEYAQVGMIHEDDELLVVEKPPGLLTVATEKDKTDTLFVRMNNYLRGVKPFDPDRVFVVHRLDRETSGLVLFAKTVAAQRKLQEGWPTVEKIYLAIVIGRPELEQGTVASYLTETTALQVFSNDHQTPGGRWAVTHYRLLQSRGNFSLLEVRLETGRKHQIRVHLAGLHCIIAGDRRYGAKLDPCRRLALHANVLAFDHPTTGERLRFTSKLPAALQKLFPTWIAPTNTSP
jgi:23S rRNA pseudouridine1911/1915/1917 synthase